MTDKYRDSIPVFFTFDSYYVVAARVAIYSMLYTASRDYRYELYVLHTTLTQREQNALHRTVERSGANAELHFIDVSVYDDRIAALGSKSHFSKEVFYKLIVAELFPQYDRIIGTDVDVVFEGDISSSLSMFADDDFYFAGVPQVLPSERMKQYAGHFSQEELACLQQQISAGYMIVNLKAIRRDGLQQRLIDYYVRNYHRFFLPEQDCMALVCGKRLRYMSMAYCCCNDYYRCLPTGPSRFCAWNPEFALPLHEAQEHFVAVLCHPVQLHYAGRIKPWNTLTGVSRQRTWFKWMWRSGSTTVWLLDLPRQLMRNLRRLSLRRFVGKVVSRFL